MRERHRSVKREGYLNSEDFYGCCTRMQSVRLETADRRRTKEYASCGNAIARGFSMAIRAEERRVASAKLGEALSRR